MTELLQALMQNQIVLALLVNMGIVTFLIRKVTWFASLGDMGRHLTALLSSVLVVTALRFAGIEPTADLTAQIPALLTVILEAVVTYAGGATAFVIAKTQPGSE